MKAKLLRTPSEKIKTWMDNAHFRTVPVPDLELAFPRLPKLQFEGLDTPRLLGASFHVSIPFTILTQSMRYRLCPSLHKTLK